MRRQLMWIGFWAWEFCVEFYELFILIVTFASKQDDRSMYHVGYAHIKSHICSSHHHAHVLRLPSLSLSCSVFYLRRFFPLVRSVRIRVHGCCCWGILFCLFVCSSFVSFFLFRALAPVFSAWLANVRRRLLPPSCRAERNETKRNEAANIEPARNARTQRISIITVWRCCRRRRRRSALLTLGRPHGHRSRASQPRHAAAAAARRRLHRIIHCARLCARRGHPRRARVMQPTTTHTHETHHTNARTPCMRCVLSCAHVHSLTHATEHKPEHAHCSPLL